MKTITLQLKHSMNRSRCPLAFLLIITACALFVLVPANRAQCPQICDSGHGNTALGNQALPSDTGVQNTAVGFAALSINQRTGLFNTAIGYEALDTNLSGFLNTALGSGALASNTTGIENTATGAGALESSPTGNDNTAVGFVALESNTTGSENTAIGTNALDMNTTGSSNIALGSQAGQNLTAGSNNIDIGNTGVAPDTGIIRIGTAGIQTATFISAIRETPLANGAALAVGITADGQLGVRASSVRFKEAIKPMDKASQAIFSFQPVTFRYKNDSAALPQFGLIAEEVAKVNPDLVLCDAEGKPFTVRYDEINAMLLNEFLKEHRKVEKLEATVAQQHKDFEAAVVELKGQIQKVSAQLELSNPLPKAIASNHNERK